MNTHVCLVSEQLIPNVLPVLKEQPERVVLLVSENMRKRGDILKKIFRERGRQVFIHDMPPYDFEGALDVCRQVIARYGSEGDITLNVTGGTKVAALAAYQQFFFDSRRIIYTDTNNDRILELGDHPKSIPLTENLLKVRECLACCGKDIHPDATPRRAPDEIQRGQEHTRQLCALLVRQPELLRDINRQISQYPETQSPIFIQAERQGAGGTILDLLVQSGIAAASGSERVCVREAKNRFYLHGGWLEEYVYNTVRDMRVAGLDCRLNVGIAWHSQSAPDKRTTNELDVLFTHKNRLHIISCKTAVLDKESGQGTGALYELDSLKANAGGLFARPMLVSVHRLRDADFRRAEELGIKVVSGGDILRLKELLRLEWGIGA